MEKLMILLLFPLAWPFIAKRIWHTSINWQEVVLQVLICTIATTAVWEAGKYAQTHDIEIWNGKIVSKDRDHKHYIRTYDCNCKEVCTGSGSDKTCREECDTCDEDHYTVTWTARSTVGEIKFDHLDSLYRSVYNSPDPRAYAQCRVGEPASLEHSYVNYVKAVPESLFHNAPNTEVFHERIPQYPRVHSFYKINRVLNVDSKVPNEILSKMNSALNTELIGLGASKQVNIVLVVTGISDSSYRYAVEKTWLGGKKNDVVVFIGTDGEKIIWIDVMTWALNTGNELFRVLLRDELKGKNLLQPEEVVQNISGLINQHFVRPKMAEFEYLENAIKPPLWVIILAVVFAIGGSLGLTAVFHRVEVDFFNRRG